MSRIPKTTPSISKPSQFPEETFTSPQKPEPTTNQDNFTTDHTSFQELLATANQEVFASPNHESTATSVLQANLAQATNQTLPANLTVELNPQDLVAFFRATNDDNYKDIDIQATIPFSALESSSLSPEELVTSIESMFLLSPQDGKPEAITFEVVQQGEEKQLALSLVDRTGLAAWTKQSPIIYAKLDSGQQMALHLQTSGLMTDNRYEKLGELEQQIDFYQRQIEHNEAAINEGPSQWKEVQLLSSELEENRSSQVVLENEIGQTSSSNADAKHLTYLEQKVVELEKKIDAIVKNDWPTWVEQRREENTEAQIQIEALKQKIADFEPQQTLVKTENK